MKRKSTCGFHTSAAVLAMTLLLVSCGGGGSGNEVPGGGVSSPVVSSGTITGFGSVIVNEAEFAFDDSTSTSVDGGAPVIGPGGQNNLRLGMVVKVSGTSLDITRTAASIIYEDTLEGPVQAKNQTDTIRGTLTVLGQTVEVDDTTKFDGGVTLTNVAVGHVIEVGGFVKGDGIIAASLIERKALSGGCALECEVKGTVKNHNDGSKTFQIGNLTVNYGAAIIGDMPVPNGNNWNGLFVEAKGTLFDAGSSTLTATRVEPEGFQAPNGNQVELEGFVTSVAGLPGSFILGNSTVQLTGSTLYLGGIKDEIAVGQKLEVEGSISSNVITAHKVKFKDAVRMESNVTSKPSGSSFTLQGLSGVTVVVTSQTEFKNVGDLAGIPINSNVRVRGREGASNSVIATEVELRDTNPDNKVELQGVVQEVVNPSVTILGVTINTLGLLLEDINDSPISPSGFFASITPTQSIVKVKGKLLGGVVWEEAELESD